MMNVVAIAFALALGYGCWLLWRERGERGNSPDGLADSGVGICDSSLGKINKHTATDEGAGGYGDSGDNSGGDGGGGDGGGGSE